MVNARVFYVYSNVLYAFWCWYCFLASSVVPGVADLVALSL